MDSRDYKTLLILEEIENNSFVSQRGLSEKLNISLGLVNSFVKHLTAKGYFRAKALPKKRIKYILTPEGVAEKTRLAYNYIRYSFDLYKRSYAKIHHLINSLDALGVKKIVFYGATNIAEITYQELNKSQIKLVAVVDDQKNGDVVHGHQVISLDGLKDIQFDKIVVTAYDHNHYSLDNLRNAGISPNKIVIIDNV